MSSPGRCLHAAFVAISRVSANRDRFYAEGWQSGYDHGRLHGLFEGRELGREKGWEIWEEVGFYEGWAGFYLGMLSRKGVVEGGRGKESR
jgi:hypothetical protein